ncbi:MAG: indolepyruvate oxidoreductase subunit beta family protein [Burkholderiales bacterium]|nr:indolepyruvate oxidoreductase subunit beta family protein [Burkholderiales bacterium]MDE2457382.1 indolepyruvate oxidoreductase subunit beta family protein [Burkholderiales bacterium]
MNLQPITILLGALGGEGGGVLSEWLYELAVRSGHAAQATSIPGVAQRTGATTYYVEISPVAESALGGRRPVFSLNPVPGAIDLLVSSELLETARQVGNGMASAGRTLVISSTARALTVAEKMQLGDGRLDSAALAAVLQRHCRGAELLDMAALAARSGSAISAVLFGAIAASGVLPWPRAAYEDTIRAAGVGVEPSLRGFAAAFDEIGRRRERQAALAEALEPAPVPLPEPPAAPAAVDLRALARSRLAAYQDADYARLYDQRLARLEAAAGTGAARVGAAAERWLALWMAFDDIVRVAALKLAASRQARVRREVGARDDEIVKTFEHFKPGIAEVAGLLPDALARRVLAWDRRRVARGIEPWALPMRIGTHTVGGALALRVVAGAKRWRRRGSRFATEQRLIERWLSAIERAAAAADLELAVEIAHCGALVKGYGSTNERGKERLLHLLDHVAFAPAPGRAEAVRRAREAALADESGAAFDSALAAQGLPKRPIREQAIRWYRRRPAAGQPEPAAGSAKP